MQVIPNSNLDLDGDGDSANQIVDWTDLLTGLRLASPSSDSAPMLRFGRFDDLPHQHLPLARFSASDWKGILIADEVGLGKTISAINILTSLHARAEAGATLVLCPGGLRRKWCNELWNRGDIIAVEAKTGEQFKSAIERIEAGEPLVLVASHGVLRSSMMLDWLVEHTPELLLTIVDEAHHIRNPLTRLHDAVTMFSIASKKVCLLTATPVNLSSEDLYVQLSQLAPGRWPHVNSFNRALAPGSTLNLILDLLAQPEPPLGKLDFHIQALEHTVGFAGDPRLLSLACLVREIPWDEDNIEELRVASADLVRRLRPLNGLVVRSRRRDLDWDQPSRRAITLDIRLHQDEWALYVAAREWSRTLMRLRRPDDEQWDWALLMPERMASSCLPAYAEHVLRQMRDAARLALDFDLDDGDEALVNLDRVEQRILSRLADPEPLLQAARALGEDDSKFEALITWLSASLAEDPEGGVILFSHFRGTLGYLQRKLNEAGISCEVITGSTNMAKREVIRQRFADAEMDVLLSSEVGSEGLDQQHCHRIVNYDLPWNPMRLEQRIGRVDRFGQQADEVLVLNLAVEGTIDAAILARLYSRINLFEESLGMLDPLLGQAMRLIAREEMNRDLRDETQVQNGLDSVLVPAADVSDDDPDLIQGISTEVGYLGGDPDDGVETLLAMRENWCRERAAEEREWLGPDPGISEVRTQTEEHGLHIEPTDLRNWFAGRVRRLGGDLHQSEHEGCELLELPKVIIEELILRCEDEGFRDSQTVGWHEALSRLADSPPPFWLTITFQREVAREMTGVPQMTPAHPLIRWLVDMEGTSERTVWLEVERPPMWHPSAAWMVCLDWTVEGLNKRLIRRWLLLDEDGIPIEEQPDQHWSGIVSPRLVQPTGSQSECIEEAIGNLHDWLLQDERQRLHPILEELRWNTRSSWESRIGRERQQVTDAQCRANNRGGQVDVRWLSMKRGLIRRLQDELQLRLQELDRLEHDLSADLDGRIIIRLE